MRNKKQSNPTVKMAIRKGVITKEQYKEIAGETFA